MEKSKKQYFNEINIMRGMAVLCVVIGHSFNPTETPTILGFIKSFVYCFHMPAFFFISISTSFDVIFLSTNKANPF